MNKKGQFFSPDLIIAVLIFIVCLGFFFVVSDSIFRIISLNESRSRAEDVIHSTMDVLVYSSGFPINWELKDLEEVLVFGLANKKNVLSEKKIISFIDFVDNDYDVVRQKIGFGEYYFRIELIDSSGNIVYSSNNNFVDPVFLLKYDRIVLVNDELSVLRGVIALEK